MAIACCQTATDYGGEEYGLSIYDIADDIDLVPGLHADGRDSGSWRRMIWQDEGANGTIVAVWKAEPGFYSYPERPLEETFIVSQGE